jgi:Guanylate kinase
MQGLLFIVAAPSGAGKSSLVNAVLSEDPGLRLSISYTTRAPRPGEADGREYHFVDRDTFLRMAAAGDFLESAEVHGNFYATSQRQIERIRAATTRCSRSTGRARSRCGASFPTRSAFSSSRRRSRRSGTAWSHAARIPTRSSSVASPPRRTK